MTKRCASCKYADKPVKQCACNDKIKHSSEAVPMKYNGQNMPYCDAYKPIYRGKNE